MYGCCPNTKFIYCPLVGVDVWKYIPFIAEKIPGLQDIITNAVIDINTHVLRLNQKRKSRMPHLATPVHTWKHNRYHHHLELLSIDGIHLSEELKKKWAHQFIKAILQNYMCKIPQVYYYLIIYCTLTLTLRQFVTLKARSNDYV